MTQPEPMPGIPITTHVMPGPCNVDFMDIKVGDMPAILMVCRTPSGMQALFWDQASFENMIETGRKKLAGGLTIPDAKETAKIIGMDGRPL